MSHQLSDPYSETIRLIVLLEQLYDAVCDRDPAIVHAILACASASRMPREVREEALAIVALPANSYRVPMGLLRLHHRLTELTRSVSGMPRFRDLDGEVRIPVEVDGDPDREDELLRVDPAQLEIRFGGFLSWD